MNSRGSESKGEGSGEKEPQPAIQISAQISNSETLSFSDDGQRGRGGRGQYDFEIEENDRRSASVSGSGDSNFSTRGHRGAYDYQKEKEVGEAMNSSRAGRGVYGSQKGESDKKGENDRIDALGRWLCFVLRHKVVKFKLNIRSDGYVAVKDILNMNKKTRLGIPLHCHTVDDFKEVVKRDKKKRFGLLEENNVLFIRANQGHNINLIDSEALLKPVVSAEEVPICVHGTYLKNLELIKKDGLSRMKRHHIHFTRGLVDDKRVISGMRSDSVVIIYLDVRKALQDGMKLFVSENGVILTEGFNGFVPPKYFARIAIVELFL